MITTFETIKEDISAFADDTEEMVIDRRKGLVLFTRGGKDYEFKVIVDEGSIRNIEYLDKVIPYTKFLTKHLADLDTLAERLVSKRPGVQAFVNGPAMLDSMDSKESIDGNALDLLMKECDDANRLSSKIVFITADAGHGKTALLRQFQHIQAKRYLNNESDFVFWHVDLLGRQLVRISEALMGDLGDLRITGLWMQSIIRLIRHGKLVVGIDGFDELAAEQGSNDALSALSLLMSELENSGTLIAASRRTFFDTEDYLKRSRLIEGTVSQLCIFNQINLENWTRVEAIKYMNNKKVINAERTYDECFVLLGSQIQHPILTRPFLLHKLTSALGEYGAKPEDFIGGMSDAHDPRKGVNSIIEAFVKREVEEKWISPDTGEPYLNHEQHIQVLSTVAEEMWRGQTDRLKLDLIETLLVLLLEDWVINDKTRVVQIFDMVKMHAFLVTPFDGDSKYRSFEHPEFKDYFTAISLERIIIKAFKLGGKKGLSKFLSIAPISDSLALYTFANSTLENPDVPNLLSLFEEIVEEEWRPTHLQTNVGTLLPFIVKDYDLEERLRFEGKVVYSSLIFENKSIQNLTIAKGTFVNSSFANSSFNNVRFEKCEFNELCINSETNFEGTVFIDCNFNGLKVQNNGDEYMMEYSPVKILNELSNRGVEVVDNELRLSFEEEKQEVSRYSKAVYRLIRTMRRTTFISRHNVDVKLHSDKHAIFNTIIPLMLKYQLLEEPKNNYWMLKCSYEEIARREFEEGDTNVHLFWKELNSTR